MTSNPSTPIPARLELDALIRYEMARLGLWRAICKRNPQLALFSEVYGDSPAHSSSAEQVSYSTSDTDGEPVHLTEQRLTAGAASENGLLVETRAVGSPGPYHTVAPAVSRGLTSGAEPQRARDGATFPAAPPPPGQAAGSAPYVTTSNGGQ